MIPNDVNIKHSPNVIIPKRYFSSENNILISAQHYELTFIAMTTSRILSPNMDTYRKSPFQQVCYLCTICSLYMVLWWMECVLHVTLYTVLCTDQQLYWQNYSRRNFMRTKTFPVLTAVKSRDATNLQRSLRIIMSYIAKDHTFCVRKLTYICNKVL